MILADNWRHYSVIDCGNGEKLERWGEYILRRPDPQAIWQPSNNPAWKQADAHYHRAETGGGQWQFFRSLPEQWRLPWRNLRFIVRPTGFKHTGLFPEQAANWAWMADRVAAHGRPVKVLNLFGYTGAATVALAAAGASVCHVDAAKGMVAWGRDNLAENNLQDRPVRWIVDDCQKFVAREIRRGNKYDAILLDPPSFGRGQNGEVWRLEDNISALLAQCRLLLSDTPCFMLLNSYTTGLQPAVVHNLLSLALEGLGGRITAEELCLPVERGGLYLPCGVTGRWIP